MQTFETEANLLSAAQALAGQQLGALASSLGNKIPENLLRSKGWPGRLIELALGVNEPNAPHPDFPTLGVELKTLPLGSDGLPSESTYICRASQQDAKHSWEKSRVFAKTARILWIPLEADKRIPIANRRIGEPKLWSADPKTATVLATDWQELSEALLFGQTTNLSAAHGTYLQLRPKAANAQHTRFFLDENSLACSVVPKGFYFRPVFTRKLLSTLWK